MPSVVTGQAPIILELEITSGGKNKNRNMLHTISEINRIRQSKKRKWKSAHFRTKYISCAESREERRKQFNTHKRNTAWTKTTSKSKYNKARKQERRTQPAQEGNTQICRLASSSRGGVYTTAPFGATYIPESCNTLQYTSISSTALSESPRDEALRIRCLWRPQKWKWRF